MAKETVKFNWRAALIEFKSMTLKGSSHKHEGIPRKAMPPEFTRERDEGIKILVNSCIRNLHNIGMSWSRVLCSGTTGGLGACI